jgi:P-type Cu2+ transporter
VSLSSASSAVTSACTPEENLSLKCDCSHCGLPVPAGLIRADSVEQFCCSGCRTVYGAIRGYGLERYYQIQRQAPGKATPATPTGRHFQELDSAEFLDAHAQRIAPGLRCVEFYLQGVHCSACVWLVERLPRVAPGVIESRLDLGRAAVRVTWQEDQAQLSTIARTLDALGYTPHVGRDGTHRELRTREDRQLLVKIAIAGAGAGNVMLLAFALYGGSFHGMEHEYSSLFRWTSLLIGLVVLLGPGSLFFRGAIAALRTRTAHLDLPIAVGLGAGAIAGTINTVTGSGDIYFDSLTGLVFLLLVGRYIQRRLERRASDAVERLFSLTPSFARLREGDSTREVAIDALELDQIVEVRPGESFPADGIVVEGDSSVDLSLLTGESRPVSVTIGNKVFAGSVNAQRYLVVCVNALGRDTRVGKLLALMDECARRKAPIVQLADRVAGYFTVGALILFVVTVVSWQFIDPHQAIDHAVSLLIVSCPCGLGLATPFAVSVALGRAARASILVKGGEVLEKLTGNRSQPPVVYLDKTGTLTEPGLRVVEWHGDPSFARQLVPAVAQLESQVAHPIACALSQLAQCFEVIDAASLQAPSAISPEASRTTLFDNRDRVLLTHSNHSGVEGQLGNALLVIGSASFVLPRLDTAQGLGRGVLQVTDAPQLGAQLAHSLSQTLANKCLTPVWIALDGSLVAVVGVGSRLRTDAIETIACLRSRGMHVAILSGDDAATVSAVGRELGIAAADCHGCLSPEEKLAMVQVSMAHRSTFMVGDGVNDSAALSAATVGIAVHGGAEASLAAADVYLGRSGVRVLIELLDGAHRTIGTIRRCLGVSLAYNVVAAALATTGYVNALVAALLMPLASFSVLAIALGSTTFEMPREAKS